MPDTTRPLLDAMANLLVDLPGVSASDPPMDATTTVPTVDEEGEPTDTTTTTNVIEVGDEPNTPSQTALQEQNLVTSVPCSIILKGKLVL